MKKEQGKLYVESWKMDILLEDVAVFVLPIILLCRIS